MFAPPVITSKNDTKSIEYKQNDISYEIKISNDSNNAHFFVKNINKIDSFYELEISFSDIQKKNPLFKIYQTIQEFINSVEGFIQNKNISIQESNNNLILNIIVFNMMNGNKENVSFTLYKKENNNKDEIIKYLCKKVDVLEEKLEQMNKNYLNLKETVDKLTKKDETFSFVWENNSNCQLLNGKKAIKKIQNNEWNTVIKGNNLLRRNEVNTFKIKVNHVNEDKSGLEFGISKFNSNTQEYGLDWHMSCSNIKCYKYNSFPSKKINEGDIMTFIADLKNGILEVKQNDVSLGKLNNLPTNEDLVPSANIYYVGDEIEFID